MRKIKSSANDMTEQGCRKGMELEALSALECPLVFCRMSCMLR